MSWWVKYPKRIPSIKYAIIIMQGAPKTKDTKNAFLHFAMSFLKRKKSQNQRGR